MCSALGQVAKHSVDLAEVVVEADIFPKALTCLAFPDEFVRKHAATLVREVVKHTPELAQLVVANGGVGALVEYVSSSAGNNRWGGTGGGVGGCLPSLLPHSSSHSADHLVLE